MQYQDGMVKIIRDHLSKINPEWVNKKRTHFEKHQYYDKETDIIIIKERYLIDNLPPHEEYYDKNGEIKEEIKELKFEQVEEVRSHEFSLEQYCSCFLPIDSSTYWGSFPLDDDTKEINLLTVATQLLNEIIEEFDLENNRSVLFKVLCNAAAEIESQIAYEFKKNTDADYTKVSGRFLEVFNYLIIKRFSFSIEEYWSIVNSTDKLLFKITQEELAALLYLLSESGILPKDRANRIIYYDFCQKYFMYMKSGSRVPVNKDNLRNKISDISNDIGGNGLKKIKDKLWPILKHVI